MYVISKESGWVLGCTSLVVSWDIFIHEFENLIEHTLSDSIVKEIRYICSLCYSSWWALLYIHHDFEPLFSLSFYYVEFMLLVLEFGLNSTAFETSV